MTIVYSLIYPCIYLTEYWNWFSLLRLVSIHMLARGTAALDAFRHWTPMLLNNPSLRNKSLHASIKVAHVELFQRGCEVCAAMRCDCDLWKPRTQDTKIFSVFRKKEQNQGTRNFITTTVGESLFIIFTYLQMQKTHNRTYDGCLWKPAERNKVHTGKQLRFVASAEAFNRNQALISTLHF